MIQRTTFLSGDHKIQGQGKDNLEQSDRKLIPFTAS